MNWQVFFVWWIKRSLVAGIYLWPFALFFVSDLRYFHFNLRRNFILLPFLWQIQLRLPIKEFPQLFFYIFHKANIENSVRACPLNSISLHFTNCKILLLLYKVKFSQLIDCIILWSILLKLKKYQTQYLRINDE